MAKHMQEEYEIAAHTIVWCAEEGHYKPYWLDAIRKFIDFCELENAMDVSGLLVRLERLDQ